MEYITYQIIDNHLEATIKHTLEYGLNFSAEENFQSPIRS